MRRALYGPQMLAFLPALALAAFWLGGEPLLIMAALGLPVAFLIAGGETTLTPPAPLPEHDVIGPGGARDLAQDALDRAQASNLATACLLVEIDGFTEVARQSGEEAADTMRDLCLTRLRNILRRDDRVVRVGDARFLIVLAPSLRLDLEALLQLSARIQSGLEEPIAIDNIARYLSACIGFCGSTRLRKAAGGEELLEAANIALAEAVANGPSAVRAWSDKMRAAHAAQKSLLSDIEKAFEAGQIQPWFQPQVCTSTGRISGVEALARWLHPERGIVPPAQFLRVLEDAGRMDRLSEAMLQQSLMALRGWDEAGLDIPRVSVNFSLAELRDPRLVDRIGWELDRFGLTPMRLGVEVLENVIANTSDDVVARNIRAMAELGCHIDLDDFGTGNASITTLRRFSVHRLKIDRSFVTRVDRDEDQRRMLAAVLGMADRLGLETLAEGVESVGEHALLAQLGCDHVQGFGIARPMPVDQIADWTNGYRLRIRDAQAFGRSSG
mgnify:CR=1 FL=1